MTGDLATALCAERAIIRRGVRHAREIAGGWVLRHPPLPDVWHLNRVHLTGRWAGLDGERLEALVAHELADAPHLRVTIDDTAAAAALWPWLQVRGWRRERSVVMVRDGSAPLVDDERRAAVPDLTEPRSRAVVPYPVDPGALAAVQRLAFADDAGVTSISAQLPARLAEAQAALRAGTDWRAFGAGAAEGGLPASTATLYLDPDVDGRRVAFVDQVATLRAHREHGWARAVCVAALRAAAAWRADCVALFADADDWPQVFYASLGFVTLGRQTAFHRRPGAVRPRP